MSCSVTAVASTMSGFEHNVVSAATSDRTSSASSAVAVSEPFSTFWIILVTIACASACDVASDPYSSSMTEKMATASSFCALRSASATKVLIESMSCSLRSVSTDPWISGRNACRVYWHN